MGKSVKTFVILLLTCIALFGATNYTKQLEVYDTQMSHASNDEMLKVFHGLKNIYIHAIISGDESLKKETLERLIKTAKVLKLDASKYESELSLINKGAKKAPVATPEKSVSPPKEDKAAVIPSQKTYKGKNILQRVISNQDELSLEFGANVSENEIKIFTLKSAESYKKIIDIPAIIVTAPQVSIPKKLTNLRISQYNGDYIRVVLDAPKEFETHVSASSNKVTVSFSKPTLNTPPPPPLVDKTPKPVEKIVVPTAPVESKKPTTARRNKTIVIDAGHGGKDAGAIGHNKMMEKHLVLEVALTLGKTLSSRGYKVVYTRQKDVFLNLRDRTKIANDNNADLFISLHANAAPNEAKQLSMKGIETFFLSPDRSERSKNVAALENQSDMEEMAFYSKETFLNVFNREKIVLSNKASIDIQSGMLGSVKKKYDVEDGGVREAPFWVLVGATMPSVLIELGYISHPEESMRLFNPQYQKLLVEGMSDGIDKYFTNNP